MSEIENKRPRKKGKKSKKKQAKKQNESEVLERVMDSIEMAGASLDFFEGEEGSDNSVAEPPVDAETDIEMQEQEQVADGAMTEPTSEEAPDGENSEVDSEIELKADEAESSEGELDAADAEEQEPAEIEAQGEEESSSLEMDEHTENMEMLAEEPEEFVDQTQAYSVIESLLFSTDKPIGMGTFKQVFKGTNFKSKDIKKALEEMMSVYADASRGVMLEEVNGGWQLRTKTDNMDFLRKLAKAKPFKLSGPALEVLSIIAYKQPIVKSEVDQIRGVESGHLVRALMEKNIVNFQGKSELPGKPMQYGTTRKFLEIFGLRNLRELPSLDEIDQLLPDGVGMEEDDEKLSDVTEKLSEEYQGNYSESEEELVKIESTLGDIDTSSEFFEEEKRRQKERRDRDRARDIREAMDVGEEVEGKDVKWLERYEARLAEEAALKEQQEAEAQRLAEEEQQAADGAEAESIGDEMGEEIREAQDGESEEMAMMNGEALPDELAGEASSMAINSEPMGPEDLIAPSESLDNELSALTAESLIEPEVLEADEKLEAADEMFEEQNDERQQLADSSESDDQDEFINDQTPVDESVSETAQIFDPFEDDEDPEKSTEE